MTVDKKMNQRRKRAVKPARDKVPKCKPHIWGQLTIPRGAVVKDRSVVGDG